MRENNNFRFFTFPIVLMQGIFNEKNQCIDNFKYYAVNTKAMQLEKGTEKQRIREAMEYYYIPTNNLKCDEYLQHGKILIDSIPTGSPLTSIEKDVCEKYYSNEKTEFEIAQLTAFAAIKSILGKKEYCKTNKELIIARMFGFNSVKELPENTHILLKKYSNRYQIDKLLNELQLYWGLKLFSDHCRGFYLSFNVPLEQLAKINIEAKKSVKLNDLKLRKKEALQAAKKELNL